MKYFSKAALTGLAAALAMTLPTGGQADEFRLTVSSSHPPAVPWVISLRDYVVPEASKKAEELGHKIIWTEAYAGALYNFENTLEGIGEGLGDIGWVGTLWEPIKQPLINVTFAAPFVTSDVQALGEIQTEMHDTIKAVEEQWTQHNTVYLGSQALDDYVLISAKPVKSVDDVKGMKFYTPGAMARWLEGTGAIGVQGGLPLYYNGIQTGVTDGAILPFSSIMPFKLHEVAPHITFVGFGGAITGGLAISKDTYDAMPEEMQKMFHEIGKGYGDHQTAGIMHNFNTHKVELVEQGATITELSEEEKKRWAHTIPNLAAEWVKFNEENGLPAREVLQALMDGARERGLTPIRDWDKELD